MMISAEVEYEGQINHVFKITAEGTILETEPEIGLIHSQGEWSRLFWTRTNKEFSDSAYKWVSAHPCLNDIIEDALLENAD